MARYTAFPDAPPLSETQRRERLDREIERARERAEYEEQFWRESKRWDEEHAKPAEFEPGGLEDEPIEDWREDSEESELQASLPSTSTPLQAGSLTPSGRTTPRPVRTILTRSRNA